MYLEKAVAGGRALARVDGRVVLVSGGIPGERVRVAIDRTGKGVAFGRVVAVESASPDRIEPASDPACGGLAFAHVRYPAQLELKRAIVEDALARIGRIRDLPPVETVASPEDGWRLRARLHVDGTRVGFFREGTHTVCDAGPSRQLTPGLLAFGADVVASLPAEIRERVDAIVVTESVSGETQAGHLELARPLPRHEDAWQIHEAAFSASSGPRRAGLSAALTASRHPTTLVGHPWIQETLTGTGLHLVRHAAAFFQGNRALLPRLVSHVLDAVLVDGPVVDLYAGVGLFGLAAAARGASSVTCVEGDAISAEDLVTNAGQFGARVIAVRGDVEAFAEQAGNAWRGASVIVDPPRAGLSPTVARTLATSRAARLIYVSCDPATLARDLQVWLAAGWRLDTVTVFDMFPVTAHVETVAVLSRADTASADA